MAKRRSKALRVSVTPSAVQNYVIGIALSADKYVEGLLRGASLYNAWVDQESTLQGKEIGDYHEDALRDYLNAHHINVLDVENTIRSCVNNNFTSPECREVSDLVEKTNYKRLRNTDRYMIEAGDKYRAVKGDYYQSASPSYGLAILSSYPATQVSEQLGNILKSKVRT
ncbi:MAG: hypothetical protein QXV58_15125 [Saccharolobus sp.]|uniref:hypothetical protein n=1 Tax=Saccharolobus sp. TaxID=2100761 RepID=UPI003165ADA3